MEAEVLLPCLQEPYTGPDPEPVQSYTTPSYLSMIHFYHTLFKK
jgi:hypothetical protein